MENMQFIIVTGHFFSFMDSPMNILLFGVFIYFLLNKIRIWSDIYWPKLQVTKYNEI